jgi:hypothetical protein
MSFSSRDSVSDNDSIYWVLFNMNEDVPYDYYISHTLDSTSGTPTTTVVLQGRMFTSEAWTTITTKTWAGTTEDTTLVFSAFYTGNGTGTVSSQTVTLTTADSLVWKGYNEDTISYADSIINLSPILFTGTIGSGTTAFTNGTSKTYWRQLRIYHDCNATVTQKYRISALEVKKWR